MKFTRKKLKNKQEVLIIDKKHLPTVAIKFITKLGSVNESRGKNGVATLSHRMSLRGPKTYKATHQFNVAVESIGANIWAVSDKEFTSFTINAERRFTPQIVKMLSETIQIPQDNKEDLEKEKITLIAQIKEIEDNPREFIATKFNEQIYKGTKLAPLSLGNIDHIPSITIDDIKSYREKYFSNHSLLVVAGDFSGKLTVEDVLSNLDKHFQKAQTKSEPIKIKRGRSKDYFQFVQKDIKQPVFVLGTFAPTYDSKDYYPFILARTILGSGFGSKMISIIREKMHLAYCAFAFYNPNTTIGSAGVLAGVLSDKLVEAISTSQQIIIDLISGKFTTKDVQRAKRLYSGALLSSVESSNSIAAFYGNQLLRKGTIKTFEQIKKELEAVAKDELVQVYRKYFDKKLYLAIIAKEKPKLS